MIFFDKGKPIIIDIVKENDDTYAYYIGNKKIGVYDPNVMGDDNILFLQNTLENELQARIKDQINRVRHRRN